MQNPLDAFAGYYGAMTDEELLCVATNEASLVPMAQAALRAELRKRGKEALAVRIAAKVEGSGIPQERSAPQKLPLALGLGFVLVLSSVIVPMFPKGESQAYYAGQVFSMILGIGLILWHWNKAKEAMAAWCRHMLERLSISDEKSAKRVARHAAYAAFVVAGLAGFLAVLGRRYSSLLDASFFGFLGLVIYRRTSRIAAVTALAAYIGERVVVGMDRGLSATVNWMMVVILLAFVSGCRGAFAYHVRSKSRL